MADEELMTITEVAERLKVSRQRVNILIKDGRLPAVQLSPRTVVIRKADVEAFEKQPRPPGRPSTKK